MSATALQSGASPPTLSFPGLPPADAAWLAETADRIRLLHKKTGETTVETGRLLLRVKERMPGEWTRFVERELPFSARTAQVMMRAARKFGPLEDLVQFSGDPPIPLEKFEPSALYALSAPSVPAAAREAAIDAAREGHWITHEKARELVRGAKPPAEVRPSPPPGLEMVLDRLDEMVSAAELVLTGELGEPVADRVNLSHGEYRLLLRRLAPELFPEEQLPPAPTAEAPGSPTKLRVMMERAMAGVPLHHPGDQLPDDEHEIEMEHRSGGAGRVCRECGHRAPPPPVVRGWRRKG